MSREELLSIAQNTKVSGTEKNVGVLKLATAKNFSPETIEKVEGALSEWLKSEKTQAWLKEQIASTSTQPAVKKEYELLLKGNIDLTDKKFDGGSTLVTKAFQRASGLVADGEIGFRTLGRLLPDEIGLISLRTGVTMGEVSLDAPPTEKSQQTAKQYAPLFDKVEEAVNRWKQKDDCTMLGEQFSQSELNNGIAAKNLGEELAVYQQMNGVKGADTLTELAKLSPQEETQRPAETVTQNALSMNLGEVQASLSVQDAGRLSALKDQVEFKLSETKDQIEIHRMGQTIGSVALGGAAGSIDPTVLSTQAVAAITQAEGLLPKNPAEVAGKSIVVPALFGMTLRAGLDVRADLTADTERLYRASESLKSAGAMLVDQSGGQGLFGVYKDGAYVGSQQFPIAGIQGGHTGPVADFAERMIPHVRQNEIVMEVEHRDVSAASKMILKSQNMTREEWKVLADYRNEGYTFTLREGAEGKTDVFVLDSQKQIVSTFPIAAKADHDRIAGANQYDGWLGDITKELGQRQAYIFARQQEEQITE